MHTHDLFDFGVAEFQRYRIAVLGFQTIDTPRVDGAQQVLVHLAAVHFGLVFAEKRRP